MVPGLGWCIDNDRSCHGRMVCGCDGGAVRMTDLKPCPFCGCSKLHRSMIDEPNLDIIVCDSCDIWFVGSDEEWNRRANE